MDDAVRAVLTAADEATVTTLPDGSVDHRYRILGSSGETLSRRSFTDRLLGGERSFLLDRISTTVGGMAVNAAKQAYALGATTRLAGHLDHPIFADLPMATASMGEPADVKIYDFEESAMMLTDESRDLRTWAWADLRAALDDRLADWLTADAVACSNWSSVPLTTAVLEDLATAGFDGGWFVVDPGDVTIRDPDDVDAFVDALSALESSYDVVLNPNDDEAAAIGDARGLSAPSISRLLERIREDADITAVVVHAAPEAAVATAQETVRVPNYDTRGPVRFTGGGDRFTGGLTVALATGADWDAALRLANACATHFVASGTTAERETLATFPSL